MLFFCQSVQQDSPFEWSILIVANGSGTISNFGIRILFKTLRVSCRNALRSLHPESCRYSSWWDVVDAKGEQNREFILHSKLCHSHFKIHSFWTSSTLPNCLRLLIDLQHPVQILHHYRNDTPPCAWNESQWKAPSWPDLLDVDTPTSGFMVVFLETFSPGSNIHSLSC